MAAAQPDEEEEPQYTVAMDPTAEVESEQYRCRFYENQYPEVEDMVVVQVKSIADIGTTNTHTSANCHALGVVSCNMF